MNTQAGFILKVLLLSAAVSILVKYGGRLLPLQPTNLSSLVLVLLPASILLLILGWQFIAIKNDC